MKGRSPVKFWKVAAPTFLTGSLLIAMVLLTAVLGLKQPSQQLTIISNLMLICMVFLPIVICSFLFYVIVGITAFGVHKLNKGTRTQLQRVNSVAENLAEKTTSAAQVLNEKSVGINSRLAFLDEWFIEGEDNDEK